MSAGLVATNEIKSFIEDGWIEDVLFLVKSGKEANVYCCRACPGRGHAFFALKVYKPRKNRSFRDAAIYQEGRVITNARTARAVRNKSRFGRAAEFGAWAYHEFATLDLLHAAGVDVPRPVRAASNAILIEFVGQGGHPLRSFATCGFPRLKPRGYWSRRCAISRSCCRVTSYTAIYPPTTCSTRADNCAS
jgi:serine/threonine-protein kinase RIO1